MKILMIGGNGFLGSHTKDLIKNEEILCPTKSEVNWVTGDGIDSLNEFYPDVIIHMLAIYGGLPFCMNNRVKMAIENLEINANVYRYIVNSKPKRLITIGSGCEYPGYQNGVLKEDDLGNGKLHRSVAHYGYSKLIQLEACRAIQEEYGIEFEHLVLANMYGPRDVFNYDRSHVVGSLIKKFIEAKQQKKPVSLMGTGKAVRDLIYVKDVADLIKCLLHLPHSTNQPLNASTGKGTSIAELAKVIAETINFSEEIIWGDETQDGSMFKVLTTDLVEKCVPEWKPKTTLKYGISETIKWYYDTQYKV